MPEATEGARHELASLPRLSDDELVSRLKGLAARERRATALLVAHLAELDTRDVYLREGYPSLFAYCCDVLALSGHEAYNRIEAARTARRFPVVLDLLEAGDVNLTAVRLLGPHLTAENHQDVLEAARGKKKSDVEEIVARLSPRADVPASLRKLPEPARRLPERHPAAPGTVTLQRQLAPLARAATSEACSGEGGGPGLPMGASAAGGCAPAGDLTAFDPLLGPSGAGGPVPISPQLRPRPAEVEPLSPDRYRYQLTIGGSLLEKLRLAKAMLRHALPSGDDEAVLDRALTALLTDLARKKFGAERKDHFSRRAATRSGGGGKPDSRYVPIAVKRHVWVRDLGRCAFVGTDGRRCDERAFVEFHHVTPYAVGGEPTVDNIQLRCQCHNRYEGRVFFEREPAGGGERPAGSGGPSGVSDTADQHRGFVPERVTKIGTSLGLGSGAACAIG